jgi:hypothetical protein
MRVSTLIIMSYLAFVALDCPPAYAHHSFSMFELEKTITSEGTVKEFQWTNPHCWIQIMVKDPSGSTKELSIEAGPPTVLTRNGWKRTSLKPGDRVTVVFHPLKDGTAGGSLVSVSVNGQIIGSGSGAPK